MSKWDSVIDFELMWEQLNRIIKPNGAIENPRGQSKLWEPFYKKQEQKGKQE